MAPDLFPFSPLESRPSLNLRRWRLFLRSVGALRIGFFTSLLFTGLMVYVTSFSPSQRFQAWNYRGSLELIDSNGTLLIDQTRHFATQSYAIIPDNPSRPSPSSSPVSDVLSLEQIRDIVAPTRGFFSRDYSLGLGWNNVSRVCWHYISSTNNLVTGAVYHRGCYPSGGTAGSYLGYTFVLLRTCVRVQYVCGAFPTSDQYSYTLTSPQHCLRGLRNHGK